MKKILLCILDGFGYKKDLFGNAVAESRYISSFFGKKNCAFLEASGTAVGLPQGQVGNSEVGHMTIGAGRILQQKLNLISEAINSKAIEQNEVVEQFLSNIQNNVCHIMCLFSSGGVHSEISHLFWCIDFLRKKKIHIQAHLFLDGRDVAHNDAFKTLKKALDDNKINLSEIATIQGRFYAMDRDNRVERTESAYDLIVNAKCAKKTIDPLAAIQNFYDKNIYDEMIPQIAMAGYSGAKQNDSFWMLNFRTDRIKQIVARLQKNHFKILNMVSCDEKIDSAASIVFQKNNTNKTLGEILALNNIKQLRIAETEKFAHVTSFFNGGMDIKYSQEDRILIKSPNVADYATTPDMSSAEISCAIVDAMKQNTHSVIVANFASPDMIGHTGNLKAAQKAIVFLDAHIKNVVAEAGKCGYAVILTSDHGNAETMSKPDDSPEKSHTNNPVPFIFISPENRNIKKCNGGLCDIAPSVLKYLEIATPQEMTGESLL